MKEVRVLSPATVANVSCGFDALGFALSDLGDEMVFRSSGTPGVRIKRIEGADLPLEADRNVAGAVARMMMDRMGVNEGVEIEIYKGFKPGSGLGSSAASGAGTAFAINSLFDGNFSDHQLIAFGMQGEILASGAAIADNVSASLMGGFILVRSYDPLEVISLPVPTELSAAIIHPQIEIRTADARACLPGEIPLSQGITQWANVGGLVAGLFKNDYELIGRSARDVVVEPHRKALIPHFDRLREAALDSGALAFGISGSGPSLYALTKGLKAASIVANAFRTAYSSTGIEHKVYTSSIGMEGTRILTST
jgi:homoserine kinase